MTVAFLVAHDCDQQRLARPSGLHKHAPLEQNVILAIAVAIIGIAPALDDAPMFHVGDWLDRLIYPCVDLHHVGPGLGREHDITRLGRLGRALGLVFDAEIDPPDRRPGWLTDGDVEWSFRRWQRDAKRSRALSGR